MPTWGLLSNHAMVLLHVASHRNVTLREISMAVGLTERAVIRIVHELEDEGVMSHVKDGRRNLYQLNYRAVLSHLQAQTQPFTLEDIAAQVQALARQVREEDALDETA
ncbi:MAG: helix-turn-helix domain-containing protein [Dehalococcoidia bacterium]